MRVEKELVVNAPVDRVYALWTDFAQFPRFMSHVESVTPTGEQQYHWTARFGPRKVEWDAKVVGLVPNRSVTWRSVSGAWMARPGSVSRRSRRRRKRRPTRR